MYRTESERFGSFKEKPVDGSERVTTELGGTND